MISIMYLKLSDHLSYMELIGVTDSPNGFSVNDQLAFSICVFVCVCVCVGMKNREVRLVPLHHQALTVSFRLSAD